MKGWYYRNIEIVEGANFMPNEVTNYKCPACTGPLHFVGESGMLECDYCDSKFGVEEIEKLYAKKEAEAAENQAKNDEKREKSSSNEWSDDETAGMKTYSCPSCGAQLICDETTAATSCPYCGNTTVIPGQFKGGLKPDLIIPFKLDKKCAIETLKNYYKGKVFLPKEFKDNNHIEEIKGVYVPFWLCDCEMEGEAMYMGANSRTWREGDYNITETKYFRVYREGNLGFKMIPVDASKKMPDAHMDAIEPFDYKELKPFSTAYLPGFLADKYDVSQEDSMERIRYRAENSIRSELRNTVRGYSMVNIESENYKFENKGVKYALMPVWLLNTKWNGKNFLFAMNGQTGKLIGDLPVDKKKFWGMFAAIAAPLATIISLIWMIL